MDRQVQGGARRQAAHDQTGHAGDSAAHSWTSGAHAAAPLHSRSVVLPARVNHVGVADGRGYQHSGVGGTERLPVRESREVLHDDAEE